jgi:hypothetical protein
MKELWKRKKEQLLISDTAFAVSYTAIKEAKVKKPDGSHQRASS